jgi:hypothetical protein
MEEDLLIVREAADLYAEAEGDAEADGDAEARNFDDLDEDYTDGHHYAEDAGNDAFD